MNQMLVAPGLRQMHVELSEEEEEDEEEDGEELCEKLGAGVTAPGEEETESDGNDGDDNVGGQDVYEGSMTDKDRADAIEAERPCTAVFRQVVKLGPEVDTSKLYEKRIDK